MNKKQLIICIIVVILVSIMLGIGFIVIKNSNQKTTTETKNIKIKDVFELRVGDTIYLNDEEKSQIKLTSIIDSRCPEKVECIWAGELTYSLDFDNNNNKIMFSLGTSKQKERKIDKYTIFLIEGDEKKIKIRVKENE